MTAASAPPDLPFLPRGAVVLAPLSGYGDLPFRRVLRGFGLRYPFAPMMDASALSIGSGRTIRIADRGEDEDWFGIQIVGNEPDKIEAAARRALDLSPTVLDLNLGCPAPKVRKKGQGCAMLGYPDLVRECVAAMTRVTSSAWATAASSSRDHARPTVPVPVTVKLRLASDGEASTVIEVIRAAAEAGACAATLHARVPRAGYSGPIRMDVLARVVAESPVPIIGNGAIHSRWLRERMDREARPYAVMVATGVMGNPWLVRHLDGPAHWGEGPAPQDPVPDPAPTVREFVEVVVDHVEQMARFYGAATGYARSRKILLRYLKGRGFQVRVKVAATRVSNGADLENLAGEMRLAARILPRSGA